MAFWDHRGTAEWVQYDFGQPKKVGSTEVYWFNDETHNGNCRLPASWAMQFKAADGSWKPADGASAGGVAADTFNKVTFAPVATTGLRVNVQLKGRYSAGILEWRVGE